MAASANPRARLEHILFHIRGVADTVGGIGFDTYTEVYHMERTVERAVQIIPEAVRALPPALTARYPEIEWAKIAAIGNVLRTNTSASIADDVEIATVRCRTWRRLLKDVSGVGT